MQGGLLKLVAGALVIGALMVFAALHLIGTEANKGRLAEIADQRSVPDRVIEPSADPMLEPLPEPMPEPIPETVHGDDGWYGAEGSTAGFTPEPFDPSPRLDDLPPEDLRFDPRPEPGVGQPQIIEPDARMLNR